MYEVIRNDKEVVIRDNDNHIIYAATLDAWVVFEEGKDIRTAQVKNLSDAHLLTALAKSVLIKARSSRDDV